MNIFFVYDTVYCKADEDDPKDAVVYFFPLQATDSQRYYLCCQLVGVAKFLRCTFSAPSVIGLDQGKFAFLWSGNYLLVLGGKSDVSTRILLDRLSFLSGIFCFYHGSFNNVLKECKNDRKEFLNRLELAWCRYIALSECYGNVLQTCLNALPSSAYKKNSIVITAANRLLHMCQLSSSVLAGAVFHNSRILSTQFLPQLTNYLSLLSNENASAPVENVSHVRNLPPDVDLKYVFLSAKSVSGIARYNHTCVGSRIRVKARTKSQLKTFDPCPYEVLSSGSEGDVDSGNCSESVRNDGLLSRRTRRPVTSKSVHRQKKLCTVSCCTGHSRLFEGNLLSCRNQNVLSMICNVVRRSKKNRKADGEDSGIHSNAEVPGSTSEPTYEAVSMLCVSHAHQWATSFLKDSKIKHSNFVSWCDAEFRCPMCTNPPHSVKVNRQSLKRWNSDIAISRYTHYQCACGLLTSKPCEGHSYTDFSKKMLETSKIQVLRCRAASESGRQALSSRKIVPSRGSSRRTSDLSATTDPNRASHQEFDFPSKSGDKSNFSNIENNDLQKHVVYVQRYGSSTLVLLLNKTYDGKVINYLWNCGFTVLRELDNPVDKTTKQSSLGIEPSFYGLVYNRAHMVLKEYPLTPSVDLADRISRETIQRIYDDFHADSHLRSMCLLSNFHSIFTSQKDENFIVYLQAENNARKLDQLCNLDKKAMRRLGKYFKVVL